MSKRCAIKVFIVRLVLVLMGGLSWGSTVYAQITLNLENADIRVLISTVAEATGKNFVIDPRVKGKVTVISTKSMHVEEIYQVFLTILKVHGFAAVPSGRIIKILPDINARTDRIPTASISNPGVGDEFITRVIQIKHVPAVQLVPILRPLIPQQAHLAAYQASNVLIVSDRAANVSRLISIIKRVDLVTTNEIDVVRLQHASASEMVRILTQLERNGTGGKAALAKAKLVADERTNSVLISGDQSSRLRMRAIITHLDTPLETEGNTHVIYLRYARAKDLVVVLEGITSTMVAGKSPQKGAGRANAATRIQADVSMNALVITAAPDVFRTLKTVIRKLDIRRAQVLVEALIAETSTDKASELGVQWRATNSTSESGAFGGTNFNLTGSGILQAAINPLSVGSGLSLGFIDGASSVLGTEFLNIGALLKALASDVNTNILSTPTLMTLDNEEAVIVVGQNVPFLTGQFTNTGAAQSSVNPFQTIRREDVGLTLKIRPQINEGNAIRLDIDQEVSSLSPTSSGASDLITNKRSIKTSVLIENGRMLVLGGLIDDHVTESEQRIPLLGDIHILGAAFRYKSTTKVKRNLMVFIRPVILRDAGAESQISSVKYNQFRIEQLRLRERGIALMPGETAPVMPGIDSLQQFPADAAASQDN